MRFSRARYVTLCQQSLVTAAVLAVGVSAAGVKTLDIVPPPGPIAGVGDVPGARRRTPSPAAVTARPPRTEVDTGPVTPKVREIQVEGHLGQGAGRPRRGVRARPGTRLGTHALGTARTRAPRAPSAPEVGGKRVVARLGPAARARLRDRRRHLEARGPVLRPGSRRAGPHREAWRLVPMDDRPLPRRARPRRRHLRGGGQPRSAQERTRSSSATWTASRCVPRPGTGAPRPTSSSR